MDQVQVNGQINYEEYTENMLKEYSKEIYRKKIKNIL